MRKFLFVFVAVLWVIAGVQLIENFNEGSEEEIVQAFNKTNCMEMEGKIQGSVKLTGSYRTRKEQEKILKDIAKEIGINDNYVIEEKNNKDESNIENNKEKKKISEKKLKNTEQTVLYLTKTAAQATTTIRFVTIEEWNGENTVEFNQYIMVDMVLYDQLECVVIYKNKLDDILSKYETDADVFMQFEGILYGKMKKYEKEQFVQGLMDEIEAEQVCKYDQDGLYTVYGYTDFVKEYTEVNGEEINVSVVVTYEEENQCSKVYLAIPFLHGDY